MLRDALLLQKREFEQRLQERYVPRDVPPQDPSLDLIRVVIGPRRAGKSLYAMHLVRDLGRFGYVNFDDERLIDIRGYDRLLAAVDSVYGRPKHLLLDEVQNLPKWELLVNRLQRQGYRLTITGSNAHLLSSELATHLTGRHLQVVLFPFSFREFLQTSEGELAETEKAEALRRYAEVGGYPEPLLKGIDYREYLRTLLRSVLYKDIVVRRRLRAPQGLDDLASCLLSSVAREYSARRLADASRLASVHTVEKYVSYLEEAFVLFRLRRFSFKVREQTRSNRKVYCTDNGLLTATSFRLSPGAGTLFENLVAVKLRKQEMEGRIETYFWKGARNEEVDFVVKRGPRVEQLLQVCVDVADPKTREREVRALLKASKETRCEDLVVLTDSEEREEDATWFGLDGRVRYVPLWKWLCEP